MHTAVDRVIRSFRSKHPVSLQQPMTEAESETVRYEATEFAAHLLENYRDQLARRSLKPD